MTRRDGLSDTLRHIALPTGSIVVAVIAFFIFANALYIPPRMRG